MIDPTDLPTLKTRLRALLADTPHPAHPHVSPADLTAILDELDAGESERARHAEEVARLEAAHLSETRALDDLRLKEIRSLRAQLRKVEGERDAERKHATEMEERALDLVRDLRLAQVELHALRSQGGEGECLDRSDTRGVALARDAEALARAWEEGAEAAFDAQAPSEDSDYLNPLYGRALDAFYASNPYRTKGVSDE